MNAMILMLAFTFVQPAVPPIENFPTYGQAWSTKGPLVTFLGCTPRQVPNSTVCQARTLPGYVGPAVIVSRDGEWLATLPAAATDSEIRRAAGLEVSRAAVPFELPASSAQRDDSPWLSRAETERIIALVPKDIVSSGVKFYQLTPRYQNLWTENNGTFHGWSADDLHHESPEFMVSGGMANVSQSLWRSVKGLDIPSDGKISVWKEKTDVRAFSLVPRWRWEFPVGTVAHDVLMADDKVFEVRTAKKTDKGWSMAVSFKDESARPAGYVGLDRSCASCHDTTSEVLSVPRQIYQRVRWGDDSRFSWRPFLDNGKLDHRWPIEEK